MLFDKVMLLLYVYNNFNMFTLFVWPRYCQHLYSTVDTDANVLNSTIRFHIQLVMHSYVTFVSTCGRCKMVCDVTQTKPVYIQTVCISNIDET
mgnify:CR=1 FL=1